MMKLKHWAAVLLVAATGFALAGCSQPKASHHSAEKTAQVFTRKKKQQSIVGYYLNSKDEIAMHFKKNGRGRYLKLYYQACPSDVKFTWKKTGKNTYDIHYDSDFQGKARLVNNRLILQADADEKNISLKRTKPFNLTDWMQSETSKQAAAAEAKKLQRRDQISSEGSGTVGKYGNLGPYEIPEAMQGTWYGGDGSITLKGNSIIMDDSYIKLYRRSQSFANSSQMNDEGVQQATKNWGAARSFSDQGKPWINVMGWTQNAGDGESYTIAHETINGKEVRVLVLASGAGNWVDAQYFPDDDLVVQWEDHHFPDLHYRDLAE